MKQVFDRLTLITLLQHNPEWWLRVDVKSGDTYWLCPEHALKAEPNPRMKATVHVGERPLTRRCISCHGRVR